MNLPPSEHIVWKLVRQLIIAGVLSVLILANKQTLDGGDIVTIVVTMAGVLGFDVAKLSVTSPKSKTSAEGDSSNA